MSMARARRPIVEIEPRSFQDERAHAADDLRLIEIGDRRPPRLNTALPRFFAPFTREGFPDTGIHPPGSLE
jgi:hypothetical protein